MASATYIELGEVDEADERLRFGGDDEEDETPTTWDPSLCTLQFSAPIFYADQAEGDMTIDVMRVGDVDSRVAAKYSTKDVSAKAGETYKATSGEVVFQPGETLKTIVVPLIHSGVWSATVEFNVALTEPSSCNLDRYLDECRVKVIDDNVFPSNNFRQGDHDIYLFWEYVKWNVRSGKFFRRCLAITCVDQLKNAYKILLLYCDMYLVNVVCDPEAPAESLLLPSHKETAYLIAAAHIVPLLFLYLGGLVKAYLDIEGVSTLHLQENVYRKYMNLSHSASSGELDLKMNRDCMKLGGGFAKSLEFLEVSVNVAMHFYFILAKNPMAAPFAVSLPAVIVVWAIFRWNCFKRANTVTQTERMKDYIAETNRKFGLVRTFFLRPQMNAGVVSIAKELEKQVGRKHMQDWSTKAGLDSIAPVFVGVYIATRIPRVLTGEIKIGTLLATIAVMKGISDLTLTAHSAAMAIIHSFGALKNLVTFLNQETELSVCKAANRMKRSRSGKHAASDALVCHDAAFSYDDGWEILADLNITAAQGKIIEVRGPDRSGKSTLMRLLGQVVRATRGEIFTMAHFRTLFMPAEAQFFDRSLTHNLTVGYPNFGRKDLPRLKRILRHLRLDKALSIVDDELASDDKMAGKDTWSEALSRTDLCMLSLARALLMNPEVLVIVSAFAGLSQSRKQDVAAALTAQVANRGFHMPAGDASQRHPRTVFFSTENPLLDPCADVIWVMTQSGELNSHGNPIWTVREDSGESAQA